jgi:hypothetical protein
MPNLLRQMMMQARFMSPEGDDPAGGPAPATPPATPATPPAKTGNPLLDLPIDEVPDQWREHAKELRRENANLRAITKTIDEAAAQKKLDDAVAAALAAERVKTQELIEGERKATQKITINSELRVIAARMGMVNLDDLKLADASSLMVDGETGQVVGAEALLTAFKESRPYLFQEPKSSSSSTDTPPPKNKPAPFDARTATPEERAAKAKELGISNKER